jgi:ABC-type spermidine/putrescine transport system permease subunit I
MIAGSTLVGVTALGFYITPALVGDPSQPTVSALIGVQFSQPDGSGVAIAMSVLLVIAVVAVYLVADRLTGVSRHWGRS